MDAEILIILDGFIFAFARYVMLISSTIVAGETQILAKLQKIC